MITFSVDNYNITVFVGEQPAILDHYKEHAIFIDDKDLQKVGTEVYIIISKDYKKPNYSIIAFKTDPVGYGGFRPGLHYESDNKILYIGAGTLIKTYRLTDNKLIFQKDYGFGFWGWEKYENLIILQEEIGFGIFNLSGEELWASYVTPPYDFDIKGDIVTLKFDDIIETRLLLTGEKV